MGKEQDSDLQPAMLASEAFHKILNMIQSSNLNFQLQVSPFSAQISLRKTLVKDKTGASILPPSLPSILNEDAKNLVTMNCKLEQDISDLSKNYERVTKACEALKNSAIENEKLKDIINERNGQLNFVENESLLLKTKLEEAYDEISKHVAETKEADSKHRKEISDMKLRIKKDSETLLEQKTTNSETIKSKKSLEKNIYNLEKKIDNMKNQIDTLQAGKKNLKTEKDNLTREIKILQNISQPCKGTKFATATTQTEPDESNNNIPPKPALISTSSGSIETSECQCSIPSTSLSLNPETLNSFECFVCNQLFNEASDLKEHTKEYHDVELRLVKLSDLSEEDPFIRYVKSIKLELDYISKRLKLYPDNWTEDHIEARIKFRLLAQKKLEICSRRIEENMKENELIAAKKYDWAEI